MEKEKNNVNKLLDDLSTNSEMKTNIYQDYYEICNNYNLSNFEAEFLLKQLDIPENYNIPSSKENIGMAKYNASVPYNIPTIKSLDLNEQLSKLTNPDIYIRLVTVTTNTITTNTVTFTTTTTTTTTKNALSLMESDENSNNDSLEDILKLIEDSKGENQSKGVEMLVNLISKR